MKRLSLFLCLLLTPSADAVDLINTYTASTGTKNFTTTNSLAASFVTGPNGWTIDGGSVRLRNNGAGGAIAFTIYDATGPNGTPGQVVDEFQTVYFATTDAATWTNYTFTAGSFAYPANTRYWIIGEPVAPGLTGTSVSWETETINTAVGYSQRGNSGVWTVPAYNTTVGFSITGTPVPEVSGVLMYAISTLTAVLYMKWKRRNA